MMVVIHSSQTPYVRGTNTCVRNTISYLHRQSGLPLLTSYTVVYPGAFLSFSLYDIYCCLSRSILSFLNFLSTFEKCMCFVISFIYKLPTCENRITPAVIVVTEWSFSASKLVYPNCPRHITPRPTLTYCLR